MSNFAYPNSFYDTADNLLAVLGTFWTGRYGGRDQIVVYGEARSQLEAQNSLNLLELIASLSRFTVPIWHKENWYELQLLQSQMNSPTSSPLRYDDGAAYGDGHSYDVPLKRNTFNFPAPADLAIAPVIFNRFTAPSVTWTNGTDFILDTTNHILQLSSNPFTDPRIVTQPIYKDGQIVDQLASLWIFRGDYDWNLIYRQFGYVVGLQLQSSEGYRQLMNVVFNAIVSGTTHQTIQWLFSTITGIPLVRETTETVTAISADKDGKLVITDQHVYKFDYCATAIVSVGDVVHRGDTLTDALEFFDLNRGETPDIQALAIGPGLIANCFYQDLIFENKEYPLQVITNDPSGMVKLQFPLGGMAADAQRFFDEMHDRGVAAAYPDSTCSGVPLITVPGNGCDIPDTYYRKGTLAHWLDTRPEAVGEPSAANMPATINPLQFLIKNVLRNNFAIVRIRAAEMLSNGLGLHNLRLLHKVLPPHTGVITIIELTANQDFVKTSAVREALTSFTATYQIADRVATVRESRIIARIVSGTCQ